MWKEIEKLEEEQEGRGEGRERERERRKSTGGCERRKIGGKRRKEYLEEDVQEEDR